MITAKILSPSGYIKTYSAIEKNNKNLLLRGENHHTFAPQKNKKIR